MRKHQINMTAEQINSNAFRKGLNEADKLPGRLGLKLRADLRRGMGGLTPQALWYRADGNVEHTEFERRGIEIVFRDYGIRHPWGLE